MVAQQEKRRAVQFICDRLEESGLYEIEGRGIGEVQAVERGVEQPRTFVALIPNFLGTVSDYEHTINANRAAGILTAPVLYKDGKTSFVRMVDRNPSWRTEKSLKDYSPQEINQMLHLRSVEKKVMGRFGQNIVYYQPPSERLAESLREFRLKPVDLDYSHIGPGDPSYGFVHNRESIDYKLPEEIDVITGAAKFVTRATDYLLRAKIVRA